VTITLKDFLSQEADRWFAQAEQRQAKRDEWVAAVRRLLDQIRAWLREADTTGVLRITEQTHTFHEGGIGHYEAPGLSVRLRDREVQIAPGARNTVGSVGDPSFRTQGLVVMTAGDLKYLLYRLLDERHGERWRIVNDSDYSTDLLDKDSFEAALVRLFS